MSELGARHRQNIVYVLNILILIFVIVVGCYSAMELSARISAKAFMNSKLDNIQRTLAEYSSNNQANSSSNLDIDASKLKLAEIRGLSEGLTALDFTGARTKEATVYATQSYYARIERDANNKRLRETIKSTLSTNNTQIEIFKQDLSIIQESADHISKLYGPDEKSPIDPTQPRPQISDIANYATLSPNTLGQLQTLYSNESINPRDTLFAINSIINQIQSNISSYEVAIFDQTNRIKEIDVELSEEYELVPLWVSSLTILYNISYLPSDIVLAILMICCGTLGSLFVAMRDASANKLLAAPIGAAAGFIAFLLVKGGKFLFLVQAVETDISINPFASAFAGIVAGLFTDRAYRTLERVFERVSDTVANSALNDKDGAKPSNLKPSGDMREGAETPARPIDPSEETEILPNAN